MSLRNLYLSTLLAVAASLFLAACDSTATRTTIEPPPLLRALTTNDLIAEITLSGNTTQHSAPDNDWIVYFELEPGRTYNIQVDWLLSGVLLMRETGSFFVDNDTTLVTPDTDFESDGSAFDNNCNGTSNLNEVLAGADPGPASANLQECDDSATAVPENPNQLITPRAWQNFLAFELSGLTERVTEFSQPLQVRFFDGNLTSAYGVTLYTRDGATQQRVFAELSFDPELGKIVRIGSTQATVEVPSETNLECSGFGPGTTLCLQSFDWKEQTWYELKFTEQSASQWEVTVLEVDSGIDTLIATLTTDANIEWIQPTLALSYRTQSTAAACTLGLPATGIQFRNGLVNGNFDVGPPIDLNHAECVEFGAGLSSSSRTDNGQTLYSLTLGKN